MTNDNDNWASEISGVKPLDDSAKNKAFADARPAPKKTNVNQDGNPPPKVKAEYKQLSDLSVGDFSGIDKGTVKKLKRGQLEIDGTIDLHGMKQDTAQHTLEQFIFRTMAGQRKLILVVTGRGGLNKPGVIKTNLPTWLNGPTLRPYIIAFEQARQEHGGSGAFYVLLRKRAV